MAEYRLTDLEVASGVSARNIRAYRERGLLDPPRRQGRSAVYDERHLAQLQAISSLLRRGFSTAHIAEFIAGIRDGHDLGDVLGMHDALFGNRRARTAAEVGIDPDGPEAQRLRELGMADLVDGHLVVPDTELAGILARAADPVAYVRAVLRVAEAARDEIDALAAVVVATLKDVATERFGSPAAATGEDMDALRRIVADHRALGERVIADRLDAAMQRHMTTAVSEYTTDVLLGGNWTSDGR